MEQCYGRFAEIYDRLTFDVGYREMADFLEQIFQKSGQRPSLVLDLACGTGSLTGELASRGYDMIGVDASEEMLMAAREKTQCGGVLFLEQPMQEFELYGTVDAIVCALDSVNYITDYEELVQVFTLCNNYLNPNGLLLFDINSPYKYQTVLADNVYTYETDDIFYTWENVYDEASKLCDFYLTFFLEQENGLYERFDEAHTQRCYTEGEILSALETAGFTVREVYDGYSFAPVKAESERIFYECVNTNPIQLKHLTD